MSLRSGIGTTTHGSLPAWRLGAVWLTMVLNACSPVASSTMAASPALGLAASSSGICQTIVALPDVHATERAFTNLAHEALHDLAADPRLARSMSARVLETMEKVEADLDGSSDVAVLTTDLVSLQESADAALQALAVAVPACAD